MEPLSSSIRGSQRPSTRMQVMEFYKISQRIKEIRKSKKLTQQDVAAQVGMTRQTLAKLEKVEIGKVSLLAFVRMLDVLDYELEIEEKKPFYDFDADDV